MPFVLLRRTAAKERFHIIGVIQDQKSQRYLKSQQYHLHHHPLLTPTSPLTHPPQLEPDPVVLIPIPLAYNVLQKVQNLRKKVTRLDLVVAWIEKGTNLGELRS